MINLWKIFQSISEKLLQHKDRMSVKLDVHLLGNNIGLSIHVQTSYFPFVEPDEICEQTIELLASEEESVSIIKEEGSRAGRSKNIKNNLETEIRLVGYTPVYTTKDMIVIS